MIKTHANEHQEFLVLTFLLVEKLIIIIIGNTYLVRKLKSRVASTNKFLILLETG